METSTMENQQPCTICNAVTTEKMVMCDACGDGFHLKCINVDETVFNREWLCEACTPRPIVQKASSPSTGTRSDTVKEISRLFEEMKVCMGLNAKPGSSKTVPEKCGLCNQASQGIMVKCDQCVRKIHVTCIDEGETTIGSGWKCSKCVTPPVPDQSSAIVTIMERLLAMERKMEATQNGVNARPAPIVLHPSSTAIDHTQFTNEGELTRSQASARKVVSGKLPTFSGDPDEWDMFYATFEESTRLCGYSDGENMQRLREALKGQALKAVKRRLYYGDNLNEVLETLKTMYGRPELVIATLLDKIRHSPAPKIEKLETLVEYGLEVEEISATIRASGVEQTYDGPLLEELVARLPPVLRLNWGMHCNTLPAVTLAQFSQWMTKVKNGALRVSPRSTLRDEKRNVKHVNVHAGNQTSQTRTTVVPSGESQAESGNRGLRKCACDDECSRLSECDEFLRMSAEDRWKYVNVNHVCKSCLRKHQNQCRLQRPCGKVGCSRKHHTLLHNYHTDDEPGRYETNNSHSAGTPTEVLLRYVPVTLRSDEREINVLALLDEGSSVSLMEHDLIKELGISGQPKPLCLSWTGGQHREEAESMEVSINISGIGRQDRQYEVPAIRTVRRLGLPKQSLDTERLTVKYRHLSSLPIPSFDAAAPRILLGMDNYHLTRPLKTVEGYLDEPVATKTRLGWVVSGRCASDGRSSAGNETVSSHRAQICECSDLEVRIERAIKGSFALEEPRGIFSDVVRSKEEERALEMLTKNTKLEEGRYTTGLLWKYEDVVLPKNRTLAVRRMECLERKLQGDIQLREAMNNKIQEYLAKGYIRMLTPEEKLATYPRSWYLPIFPVFNPNKPNKIRIVWDAAATFRGHSLNSVLSTGPDLLAPLSSVLQRFRERRIAVAADISEMYHQVRVNEQDQQSQRFLWKWTNEQGEPDEYVMLRMTFGASCSPSCAQYVKNTNAERFSDLYPEASRCIKEDHYVDDMLASVEEVDEAVKLAQEFTFIHLQGGFPLHNWMSNSAEVLQVVDGSNPQQKDLTLEPNSTPNKVLGMWWDSRSDTFCFKTPTSLRSFLAGNTVPTKRQLLSLLMSIYDPLGLIAGFLFFLKIILQEVWRAGVDWDQEIPPAQLDKWTEWIKCLPQLETVSIPRCYRQQTNITENNVQLHIFVDAGIDGFAAVAYFRFEQAGKIEVALVGGKSRVAPLKYTSVPRLELQAAVLGTRLANSVKAAHRQKVNCTRFWTDSKDVICWLRSDHRRYSTYVAHRVGEILETTDVNEWQWISTHLNVADEATKWSKPSSHLTTSQWFTGPKFLSSPEDTWNNEICPASSTEEEQRKAVCAHLATCPIIEFDRFSKWKRLLRSVGYVLRFINNARLPSARQTGPLTAREMQAAERVIIKDMQRCTYPEEYQILAEQPCTSPKKTLPRDSRLVKRSPYMDSDGIMRVKGRIDACSYVGHDTKRPIILPKAGKVTDLIVDDYHRRYKHQNHQTVINEVRQKYDVPALRTACHRVRTNCQFCRVRKAVAREPIMGDLPAARLSPFARPFSYTGIDYFGPFTVVDGRKTQKRWGVLFTCLTVRAIHIEMVPSLSTSACIIAVRNFIARRGTPLEIYSDRGTNFIGASRELREALKEINMNEMVDAMNLPDTQWIFNPPAAPHFGGAWERLVRTVKQTLHSIQFTRLPTDAVLHNWLIEVEHIVNARPLTDVPVDREEDGPITPNHFLLGSSAGLKPLVPLDDSSEALRNNWKTSQIYANLFWRKWVAAYLPTLTRRTKWFQPCKPLKEGDVVLIIDENLPRGCWPKGRIIRAIQSKDGAVRRVHVRLATGKTCERPAVKVAAIDIDQQQGDLTSQNTGGQC